MSIQVAMTERPTGQQQGADTTPASGRSPGSGAPGGRAVSHASPLPLYTQLRELLRERILDGTYRSGQRMPSEHEMVRAFGVSRITVRQALNDLQQEGVIFKIHGKGTFVSRAKAVQSLLCVEGFGEAMAGAGHETFSRVLGHRTVRAGKAVGARLRLAETDEVMEIRRLRYLDREPISLDVTYLPTELGRRLVREDLVRRDVFAILENDFALPLERADLRIEAIVADGALAGLLEVPEGAAVLRIERLTYTTGARPVDFEFLYYRGDAFQYSVRVGRRAGPGRRSDPNPSGDRMA